MKVSAEGGEHRVAGRARRQRVRDGPGDGARAEDLSESCVASEHKEKSGGKERTRRATEGGHEAPPRAVAATSVKATPALFPEATLFTEAAQTPSRPCTKRSWQRSRRRREQRGLAVGRAAQTAGGRGSSAA
jgi:hypothetical protein